jgi:predicted nucleic acid-binding protein
LSYLVDTNVLSELRKGRRCYPGVAAWFARVASEEIYLSALTRGRDPQRHREHPPAR